MITLQMPTWLFVVCSVYFFIANYIGIKAGFLKLIADISSLY